MDIKYFQDLLDRYKGVSPQTANPLLNTSLDQTQEDLDALQQAEQQGLPLSSADPVALAKKEQDNEDKEKLAFFRQNSEGPETNAEYAATLAKQIAAQKPLISTALPQNGPSIPDTAIGAAQAAEHTPIATPIVSEPAILPKAEFIVKQPLRAPAVQQPTPEVVSTAAPEPIKFVAPAEDPLTVVNKELEEAKAARDRDLEYAKWADVAGTIDKAIRQKENPLDDQVKMLRERSGTRIKDVATKQDLLSKAQENIIKQEELASKKSKAEYEKILKDPNSALSKSYKNILKDMGYDLGNVSAYDIQNNDGLRLLIQSKENVEARKEMARANAEMRKDAKEMRLTQQTIQNMGRYQDAYNKDKLVQESQKKLDAAEDAEALLLSNNPIADEAAKGKMARLSGEVGVLTDQDISRFGGSRAWLNRVQSVIDRGAYGSLTAEDKKLMLGLTQTLKEKADKQLASRAEALAEQGAKRFGMSKEEAYDYLRPGKAITVKKAVEPVATAQVTNKIVIKKGYNQKTNQTQLIYSDGTKEIVDGKR